MRVVVDATPVAYGERAVQRNAENLILHLLTGNGGIDYVIFSLDWRRKIRAHIELPEGSPHRLCRIPVPGRLLEWSWRHFSCPTIEHMVGQAELVYGTDLLFPPSRRAVTLGTLRGIAYRVLPNLIHPVQRETLECALQYTLRESDYLLVVSHHTKQEAMDFLQVPEHRIKVSPHGVDPRMQRLQDRATVRATLSERHGVERPYLLYVGAISQIKNVLRLVEAFALISSKFPEVELVLVGPADNAYRGARLLAKACGLETRVRFLGSLPPHGHDLVCLYNGAELLIVPSLYEGWTAVPLEAMACGVPVVASDLSSIPETCGGAALFVDPLRAESIAEGAMQVLTDGSLRETLVKRGFERVAACQWSYSAKRLEAIFRELVASGRCPR